jgi:CRISPR/Cas system-associated protein Cas10 (large subunit of type III CRISPR-Cas system)
LIDGESNEKGIGVHHLPFHFISEERSLRERSSTKNQRNEHCNRLFDKSFKPPRFTTATEKHAKRSTTIKNDHYNSDLIEDNSEEDEQSLSHNLLRLLLLVVSSLNRIEEGTYDVAFRSDEKRIKGASDIHGSSMGLGLEQSHYVKNQTKSHSEGKIYEQWLEPGDDQNFNEEVDSSCSSLSSDRKSVRWLSN